MISIPQQPWLHQAKSHIRDLFEGRRSFAFTFDVMDPASQVGLASLMQAHQDLCATLLDHKQDLQVQAQSLIQRFELGYPDDFVYSLHPYTGVGFFASAFGCRTEFPAQGNPVTHPAIRAIEDVDTLKPDIARANLIQLAMDKIKYFQDQTGATVPIAFPDLQSPIDTASIVLDYTELMCALKTDPVRCHRLLTLVTDVMEEVLDRLRELLADWSPSAYLWMPKGIWLSDDLMAVVPPNLYEEFALPYINRLGQRYGGVFVHSCGRPIPVVPSLTQFEELMGVHYWEIALREFLKAGGNSLSFCASANDAWQSLDRRAARRHNQQVIDCALADLQSLESYVGRVPVFFAGTSPQSNYNQEYYETLCRYQQMGIGDEHGNRHS